jgi:hypothetical protein
LIFCGTLEDRQHVAVTHPDSAPVHPDSPRVSNMSTLSIGSDATGAQRSGMRGVGRSSEKHQAR